MHTLPKGEVSGPSSEVMISSWRCLPARSFPPVLSPSLSLSRLCKLSLSLILSIFYSPPSHSVTLSLFTLPSRLPLHLRCLPRVFPISSVTRSSFPLLFLLRFVLFTPHRRSFGRLFLFCFPLLPSPSHTPPRVYPIHNPRVEVSGSSRRYPYHTLSCCSCFLVRGGGGEKGGEKGAKK